MYKNIVTDEDGNKTIEFKNAKGQLLLVRKIISATENADTYYVYNEYDQLAFVIPPLLSKLDSWGIPEHDALAYQYRYDIKGRLVEKKLPGKGWEYMVYDKADRMILSQDANQRASFSWIIYKYDIFGRPIYTGIKKANNTRIGMQNQISGGAVTEGRANMPLTANGMDYYYTNMHWGLDTLLSVTYYDSYPQQYGFNPPIPSMIQGEPVLTETPTADGRSTKGMPVMSLVKNIEDDGWTKTYTYYDRKGRVIGTHSINHLGGYTHTESKLDFAGLAQQTITTHVRKAGEPGITVKERFVYDNGNRLKEHYHQLDSNPEELLAKNSYNELSQLVNKEVGNNLQSIDYAYNIRGWMTDINKNQMSLTDLGGKLFSYKIKYTQKDGITNADPAQFVGRDVLPKFNGNIAEVDWRTVETLGVNPSLMPKRYGYAYDKLNRLTTGYYQNPNNPYSKENTESLQYDLNGNIVGLFRTSVMENGSNTATVIDNLAYDYIGNQAVKIKDNSNNKTGYEGTVGLPIEYDANGNMKNMQDKQISEIKYNHLNLPQEMSIDFGPSGTVINNRYRADGTKLEKTAVNSVAGYNNVTTTTEKTEYLDGFQYYNKEIVTSGGDPGGGIEMLTARAMEPQAFSLENRIVNPLPVKTPDLQFFPTSEGFYDYQKNQYIYQYKDHLGNVRVSFGRNSAGALEITDANDYYPFGMNHLKTGNALFGQGTYKNYKYNGKELQETGAYDFGARQYMSDIGRWIVHDPLSEEYRRWSPYNYAMNNPISFIDPDGRGVASTGVKDNKDGTYTVVNAKNDGNTGVYITDEKGNYDINSSQKIAETHLPTEFMQANNITGGFEGHINATFSLNPEYNMKINGKAYKNLDGNEIKNIYVNLFKQQTKGMGWYDTLSYLRDNSGNGKKFDIKASVAGFSPESVVMLDGKLTTIRGLGNEIFGANMNVAADKSPFHQDFFYHQVMPKVGAYNQSQNKGATGYNSGWPFYGEHTFSGSYIFHGYYGRFPYRTDIKY